MSKARDLANGATALSAVSATELGYLDGVTSAVQTQLDAKQAANAAVSTTELGYLDGVTSAIQTQLNQKPEYVAGKNRALNSAFQVWQRGTSIALAASSGIAYTADRWCTATGANQACTISRQATGDTTNLPNIQYALRFQRNSGQTGTGVLNLIQSMESINSIPLAGRTITLSFYARAGANFSSASNLLTSIVATGTGTDQNLFSGYTGQVNAINQASTLTTTWQRFTYSGTVASTATEISLQFNYTPVGTAGANDWFEVTGVQLEVGSVATAYAPNGSTYQVELAACQRYYWKIPPDHRSTGSYYSTTACYTTIPLPVQMRVAPTYTTGTLGNVYVAGATRAVTAEGLDNASVNGVGINMSTSAGTAGQAAYCSSTGTQLSAEL